MGACRAHEMGSVKHKQVCTRVYWGWWGGGGSKYMFLTLLRQGIEPRVFWFAFGLSNHWGTSPAHAIALFVFHRSTHSAFGCSLAYCVICPCRHRQLVHLRYILMCAAGKQLLCVWPSSLWQSCFPLKGLFKFLSGGPTCNTLHTVCRSFGQRPYIHQYKVFASAAITPLGNNEF